MIKVDWSKKLFASLVTKNNTPAVIALNPLPTLEQNQKNLDEALENAYYSRKAPVGAEYLIIYMSSIKFVYFCGSLAGYFTEVPENLNKIKEWFK